MSTGLSVGQMLRLILCAAGVTALALASVHLDRFRTVCRLGYSGLQADVITRKLDSCLAEGDFVGVAILGEQYDIADLIFAHERGKILRDARAFKAESEPLPKQNSVHVLLLPYIPSVDKNCSA